MSSEKIANHNFQWQDEKKKDEKFYRYMQNPFTNEK